jgi:hypothetical protein
MSKKSFFLVLAVSLTMAAGDAGAYTVTGTEVWTYIDQNMDNLIEYGKTLEIGPTGDLTLNIPVDRRNYVGGTLMLNGGTMTVTGGTKAGLYFDENGGHGGVLMMNSGTLNINERRFQTADGTPDNKVGWYLNGGVINVSNYTVFRVRPGYDHAYVGGGVMRFWRSTFMMEGGSEPPHASVEEWIARDVSPLPPYAGVWARDLADGRVEMYAFGPEAETDLCDAAVWPGGEIPSGDADIELPCEWTHMRINCDMSINGRFTGPGGDCHQILRVCGGTVTVGDRWYVADSGSGVGALILEGDAVVNSLSTDSGSFRCADDGGRGRVEVRDNAVLNISGGWRNSDAAGGWAYIQVADNAAVNVSLSEEIRIGDDGAGVMHFDGGHVTAGQIKQSGRGGVSMGKMTISGNAEVYCADDFSIISEKAQGRCDMTGGTVNVRNFNVHAGGADGTGELNMTGGLIMARESFNAPREGNGATAEVHLDGGEIRCGNFNLPPGGRMDITEGKLVIEGNKVEVIAEVVCDAGRLTGYDSPRGIVLSYDAVSDKTIVTATPAYDPFAAYCPTPADGTVTQKCVSQDVVLSWKGTGGVRDRHGVYIGTDCDCVANGTPSSPCFRGYVPGSRPPVWNAGRFPLGSVVCWRIDEFYYGAPAVQGPVWTFTCDCPPIAGDINDDCIVNFQDYADVAESWQQEQMWPPGP